VEQSATTLAVTGGKGGFSVGEEFGGVGVLMWGRALAGGGSGVTGVSTAFGGGLGKLNSNGDNATANTGGGGGSASTNTTTKYNGGNGGSGLVVLRFVGV
jgi:hypothetical protein